MYVAAAYISVASLRPWGSATQSSAGLEGVGGSRWPVGLCVCVLEPLIVHGVRVGDCGGALLRCQAVIGNGERRTLVRVEVRGRGSGSRACRSRIEPSDLVGLLGLP